MVRAHMDRAHRAKQFAPFAALCGYEEALRRKERITVPRAELSEDMLDELDNLMNSLAVGDMISIIYYDDSEYIRKTGMITRIDKSARIIRIVNTDIAFFNIYRIDIGTIY